MTTAVSNSVITRTDGTCKKYGIDCERIEFQSDNGRWAWIEQDWFHRHSYSAYRWSEITGPVVMGSWFGNRDGAIQCAMDWCK